MTGCPNELMQNDVTKLVLIDDLEVFGSVDQILFPLGLNWFE